MRSWRNDGTLTRSFPTARDRASLRARVVGLLAAAISAGILYVISRANFSLYHALIELISVVVALTIFSIGWHTRKYATSALHLVIAVGYLFVGLSDSLHLIFFRGMGVIEGEAASSLTMQLFLLGRLIEGGTLFAAVWTLGRVVSLRGPRLLAPAFAVWLALITVVLSETAPQAFIAGSGTTWYATGAIFIACALIFAALMLLNDRRRHLRPRVAELLGGSMALMLASYVIVPFYTGFSGTLIYFTHILKLLAYVLLYRALVVGALAEPYYTLFLDLTNSELAARKAKTSAENASHEKTEFIARVSHEIRTPMNSVIGLSTLLLETELNPTQRRYASMMRESANVLIALVNQVLEYSKLEEHAMKLSDAPFAPREVVEGVTEMFSLTLTHKEVAVSSAFSPDVPGKLVGDAPKLRQVLVNLVGNAIKFTESGSVSVTVSVAEWGANPLLRFVVADTGKGIPEKDLPRLFMPYEQVDGATAIAAGTGLGLVISKQIIELMGGEVSVESTPGVGSVFTFTARFSEGLGKWTGKDASAQRGIEEEEEERLAAMQGLRALVADDNEINRVVTSAFLQKIGFSVDTAENGQLAVEAAKSRDYGVIFMDVRMPVMDGLMATRAIRALGLSTPVVGLTAAAFDGDREACLESGMNIYLTKPVDEYKLYDALSGLLVPVAQPPDAEAEWTKEAEVGFGPLLKRFSSNPDKLREITSIFLQDCAGHIDNLGILVGKGEKEEGADVAHALRGCFVVFGAAKAGRLAKEVELSLRGYEGRDTDTLLAELAPEMARIEKYIKAEVARILGDRGGQTTDN